MFGGSQSPNRSLIGMAENKSSEVMLVSSRVISEKGRKVYGADNRGLK